MKTKKGPALDGEAPSGRRGVTAGLLEQSEVAALLRRAPCAGAAAAPPGGAREAATVVDPDRPAPADAGGYNVVTPEDVCTVDFRRPVRLPRDRVAAVAALHEVFAWNLSASLSGSVRAPVEVELASVEQITYAEFTTSVPAPTVLAGVSCEPLEVDMAVEIGPGALRPLIDRLGGSPRLDGTLAPVEKRLIGSIITGLLDELRDAWLAVQPITFRIGEVETNPSLLQVAPPDEPVVLLGFDVGIGEHSGVVHLCIPSRGLVAVPGAPAGRQSGRASERVLENVKLVEVEYAAILAEVMARAVDILSMQPGDILDCGVPAPVRARIAIGNQRPYTGWPESRDGTNAVVITGIDDTP